MDILESQDSRICEEGMDLPFSLLELSGCFLSLLPKFFVECENSMSKILYHGKLSIF